jgi:arylformamidase
MDAANPWRDDICSGAIDNGPLTDRSVKGVMSPEDYPEQEPFTAIGEKYHAEVMRRGAGVRGIEVSYGANPYQALSVIPAERPSGDVLIVFHGGGWTNGYKEWMQFMAPALVMRGVTFVSAGYRLAPQHLFPSGYHDALDAVVKTHRMVSQWGGDPSRIFLGGHSAGGHLAALAALRWDWQIERGLPVSVVRGALPISGTYLFGPRSGLSMRPRFLGPVDGGADAAASPMTYVATGAPPFLISYGENDFPHLRRQAQDFENALRTADADVSSMMLAGCDHLGASYASGEADGAWVKAAVGWMRRH